MAEIQLVGCIGHCLTMAKEILQSMGVTGVSNALSGVIE